MSESLRALGVLCEPPADGHDAVARALGLERAPTESEWTNVFLLELVPYASVYLGAEGMIGGEARDRVAGFWRALGLEPPREPDHLAALLGLVAALSDADEDGVREALLHEHVLSWAPVYLERVEELAAPVVGAWARLLRAALAGEEEGLRPLARPALHHREAPPLDPEAGDLVGQLLAPARSGFLLARADLVRCARELGLGLRIGERRFALEALLAQDPASTLAWLAGEAERQAATRNGFWRERARAASALLSELVEAASAKEVAHAR